MHIATLLASLIIIEGDLPLEDPSAPISIRTEVAGSVEKLRNALASSENPKQTLYAHYQEAGRPFILIEERKEGDDLILKIRESRLGKIVVEGEHWSPPKSLSKWLLTEPGAPISTQKVRDGVLFGNRHPLRKAQAIFAAGDEPLTTDIRLVVEEKKPLQFMTGIDNTGVEHLGRARWMGGFNWGNAFGIGHVLSYQYLTSLNFKTFQAHTAQYAALFSWRHTLSIFGGYSAIQAKIAGSHKSAGYAFQSSLRYAVPLSSQPNWTHEMQFGFDFKRTNNSVEWGGEEEVYSKNVNLTQLNLGYEAKWKQLLSIQVALYGSPGKWLSDQSNADYNSLRPGAKNRWIYGRALLDGLYKWETGFEASLKVQGQLASGSLVPSEQLGIGGHSSVRGYEERQLNKDFGALASFEIRSPSLHLTKKDRLYFLLFADLGLGSTFTTIDPIPNFQYLASIGPGIRYGLAPYLNARIDWGFQLKKDPLFKGSLGLIHFALSGFY